jgi:tetratricopeptide (TPR) repeat protein
MQTLKQLLIAAALPAIAISCFGQEGWKADLEAGSAAAAKREYTTAKASFQAALAAATEAKDDAGVLDCSRRLAAVHRIEGEFAEAEKLLAGAVPVAVRVHGDKSDELATVLSELGNAQRAQHKLSEALLTLDSCIRTRQLAGSKPLDTVRDVMSLARVLRDMEDFDRAGKRWREALEMWDAALPQDSPEILPVMDELASLHRDKAEYELAEPLLRRALIIRESMFGPSASDLISTLDSLAYVLFGQKKHVEAEPFYKRLLDIWKTSAGPDHPMVALTLDKMAEFYAAQERYADAEPLVAEALAIRTLTHLQSLNQTGRIKLMQAKLAEADELYKRAIRIGDESAMPDEVMDPLLRVEAKLLRELKQPEEAAKLEKRVKEAFLRNTNVRPSPVKIPATK